MKRKIFNIIAIMLVISTSLFVFTSCFGDDGISNNTSQDSTNSSSEKVEKEFDFVTYLADLCNKSVAANSLKNKYATSLIKAEKTYLEISIMVKRPETASIISDAKSTVREILKDLELPSYLINDMFDDHDQTGKLTEKNDKFAVTYNYYWSRDDLYWKIATFKKI